MPRPRDIPVIDTLIGFRDTHQMGVASTKGDWQRHPAEYMFKEIPDELTGAENRFDSIAETVAQMDAHNIRVGVIHMSDDRAVEALHAVPSSLPSKGGSYDWFSRVAKIKPSSKQTALESARTSLLGIEDRLSELAGKSVH